MKYIWYLPKTCKFCFYNIICIGYITEKGGAENAKKKRNSLANPNNFGTKIFVTFKLRKYMPTLDVFVHKYESYGRLKF